MDIPVPGMCERWSDGEGSGEPADGRAGASETGDMQANPLSEPEGAMRMESLSEYRRRRGRLPRKASSIFHIGPYRKWTHMGEERILR